MSLLKVDKKDINKTSESKEYINCHYCYLLDKVFKVQPDVYSGCHDVSMISILNINSADYGCIISRISKSEAIDLMIWLKKAEHYNIIKHKN